MRELPLFLISAYFTGNCILRHWYSPGPDGNGNPVELFCSAVFTKRATNGMLLFGDFTAWQKQETDWRCRQNRTPNQQEF
ncbi:hypothetical protein DXU93_06965 [Brumimicrobium aurantiacum]|uniref:Uncharacterized protein n=1 Tax=Brumimicrobium aurantiacum TaxID=1737063 RepID=A0A3E1EYS9_9FLAO|nr:hypothetical protein DXU93_06965 [Brumimicrobium aurantiacum]